MEHRTALEYRTIAEKGHVFLSPAPLHGPPYPQMRVSSPVRAVFAAKCRSIDERAQEKKPQSDDQRHGPLSDKRRSMIPLCARQSDRVCRTSRAVEGCREGWQARGVWQSPVFRTDRRAPHGFQITSAQKKARRHPVYWTHIARKRARLQFCAIRVKDHGFQTHTVGNGG
jgi:hypothetical protein